MCLHIHNNQGGGCGIKFETVTIGPENAIFFLHSSTTNTIVVMILHFFYYYYWIIILDLIIMD